MGRQENFEDLASLLISYQILGNWTLDGGYPMQFPTPIVMKP